MPSPDEYMNERDHIVSLLPTCTGHEQNAPVWSNACVMYNKDRNGGSVEIFTEFGWLCVKVADLDGDIAPFCS